MPLKLITLTTLLAVLLVACGELSADGTIRVGGSGGSGGENGGGGAQTTGGFASGGTMTGGFIGSGGQSVSGGSTGSGGQGSGGASSGGDNEGTGGSNRPVGLTARPSNSSCVAPARVVNSGALRWEAVRSGASNLELMMMRQLPDGAWLEVYREGRVYYVSPGGNRAGSPALTIDVTTDGEMGLLGLAVHPGWPSQPYVYFFYARASGNGAHYIDRYTADPSASPVTLSSGSRVEIARFDRGNPWLNHVGGTIQFDPRAATPTLYVALGDAEVPENAQSASSPFGKLIRIDVSASPYPREVVAMGLRNPFRWSFDSATGDLWIGDVGDADWEEVNFVPYDDIPRSGQPPVNFGWPIMEGSDCHSGPTSDPSTNCGSGLTLERPVHAYDHSAGVSVIGGYAYRGTAISGIEGHYFFNDIFPMGGNGVWKLTPGTFTRSDVSGSNGIVSYAEDRFRNLYAMTRFGTIMQLMAGSGGGTQEAMPAALSQTGCFDAAGQARSGLVPYDIKAPLWSDGAEKRRFMALPDGAAATLTQAGDFEFPAGTVLVKEFYQEDVHVETRLFVRHPDGVWAGYSYAFIDGGGNPVSDGQLLPDQVITRAVPGTGVSWTYPSRTQCTQCHTTAAGGALGLEVGQLNMDMTYPSTGTTANQLHTLRTVGMIGSDIARFGNRVFPGYDETSAPLADRAWAYLHSNCAGCHQPGADGFGGRSNMPDIRYDLFDDGAGAHPLADALCGVTASAENLGLPGTALLVNPGNPGSWNDVSAGGSVLYLRMSARPNVAGSTGTMPQIGTARVDDEHGLPLMRQFINALNCP